MQKKGVHIQIINSILDFTSQEWGLEAKRALLKISRINLEELEGVQNYIDQEIFYKLLDTIKYDLNRENRIRDIGAFCANTIIKDSSYLHPILSQGNPLKFLKESDSVFSIFFPGCNFKIIQVKTNSFLLNIPLNKKMSLSLFIKGFLEEIIANFTKNARIYIKEKYKDTERNNATYSLRYVNINKFYENLALNAMIVSIMIIAGIILWFVNTPLIYFVVIELLSVIAVLYPITLYIENKKNMYNRNLIKELNALEKVLLGDKEMSALEIINLKASIAKLNEFGDSILGENDLDMITDRISYDAKILLGSENARVIFYDRNKYHFYTRNNEGTEIEYFNDQGIIGLISKMKKPMILNDPSSNNFYKNEIKSGMLARNIIAAPILDSNDELIAIIEISNKIEKTDYTEIDMSILISICNYASLALQKYRMLKNIIDEEHIRVMERVSKYFSSRPFINVLTNDSVPNFEGKNQLTAYLKKFLFTFGKSFNAVQNISINQEKINVILKNYNLKIINVSTRFDSVEKRVFFRILQILISNSVESAIEKNKKIDCDIFCTDEVFITEDIRKQYNISMPINEWNSRKEDLGKDFKDYLVASYPLLDKDIYEIEQKAIYKPKLLYIDRCGGIAKEIEEKIFYPFFSTKKNHMGIGLNLLKKIVEEINGEMEFLNIPGTGISVAIFFDK